MGVTQNSRIPRAWEVSDLKVLGATRPRPLNRILPSHLVYNYMFTLKFGSYLQQRRVTLLVLSTNAIHIQHKCKSD